MEIWKAIIIAIVEGITEFLPVSSTGHMIITNALLGVKSSDFVKLFTIGIQFGAILAVVVKYYKKFLQSFDFYFKLFVGFLPIAIIGFAFNDIIDQFLESVVVVAINLIIGGFVLLGVDNWFKQKENEPDQEINFIKAIKIGFFQCIALLPGVSRSAATIIGGMAQGLSKKQAAEFSFFLAVPTMFVATAYKLYKFKDLLNSESIKVLAIGNVVAFLVALWAIQYFVSFVTKNGFKIFGYYRIVVGIVILAIVLTGGSLNII